MSAKYSRYQYDVITCPFAVFYCSPNGCSQFSLNGVKVTGKNISCGAYGNIFEVEYEGVLYTAKEMCSASVLDSSQNHDKVLPDSVIRECQTWSRLCHPCIVQFIGLIY